MKKQLLILASLCVLLTACEKNHNNAYNTARNVRDRNGQTMTPADQSESQEDLAITQKIRSGLMDDDSLSTNAKNVKIITVNGVVTLRGPVNSEKEKNDVAKIAKSVKGVRSIDNQLEIVTPNEPRTARNTNQR
jgi:hyperosmotically inducible periplasmic protein